VRSSKALIELLGVSNVATALELLGIVGLSDAFVYLKRFRELSNGQQYRAMLGP
jgi:ABC-type ATPase with predicted acetyltransferase domain